MPGIATLAEKVFQLDVALGRAGDLSGLATALQTPEFATAIGLVKYGALLQRQPAARLSWWARLWGLIRKLVALP